MARLELPFVLFGAATVIHTSPLPPRDSIYFTTNGNVPFSCGFGTSLYLYSSPVVTKDLKPPYNPANSSSKLFPGYFRTDYRS